MNNTARLPMSISAASHCISLRLQTDLLGESELGRAAQASGTYYEDDLADGHTTHIAFEVEDLEEAQRHLKEHGVAIVCGPRPRGNDGEQLYIRDPDGYVIELFARRGGSPKKHFAHRAKE
jgi:catechol 2,3-dioxygenase-like lactoylglutathione lyase family enzyme